MEDRFYFADFINGRAELIAVKGIRETPNTYVLGKREVVFGRADYFPARVWKKEVAMFNDLHEALAYLIGKGEEYIAWREEGLRRAREEVKRVRGMCERAIEMALG